MALQKNVNSYVNTVEADFYFEDRLDATAWTSASEAVKEQALVTATANLDNMTWTGVAVSETQNLAFPRIGSYFDPKFGTTITFTSEVPQRIKVATYELALHLMSNDDVLSTSDTVRSLHIGTIKLIDIKSPSVPSVVKKQINPMLTNSGANLWWRAN